jgi:hypothetical protein
MEQYCKEIELKFGQICATRHIYPQWIGCAEVRAMNQDAHIAALMAGILHEDQESRTETLEVRYPDGPLQAFKAKYAPGWILKRWPVREAVKCQAITFVPQVYYPSLPEKLYGKGRKHIQVIRLSELDGFDAA